VGVTVADGVKVAADVGVLEMGMGGILPQAETRKLTANKKANNFCILLSFLEVYLFLSYVL